MRILNDRQCNMCTQFYTPTGSNSKHCAECLKIHKKEVARVGTATYRNRHNLIKNPGVGSGNSQLKGKDSPYFKSGIGLYKKLGKALMLAQDCKCSRCGIQVNINKKGSWATHHKDHNRSNNEVENLEPLCKRCHQIEHKCWEAFSVKV